LATENTEFTEEKRLIAINLHYTHLERFQSWGSRFFISVSSVA